MRPLLLVLATATLLPLAGCSFQDPPTTAPLQAPSPAPPEAQDPCTQVALSLLDGQLEALPSADPEAMVRANAVVAEFVDRYDAVLVASGVPAARAALAGEVAAACQRPAAPAEGSGPPEPMPSDAVPPPAIEVPAEPS